LRAPVVFRRAGEDAAMVGPEWQHVILPLARVEEVWVGPPPTVAADPETNTAAAPDEPISHHDDELDDEPVSEAASTLVDASVRAVDTDVIAPPRCAN
jgi:hypothetical protein